MCIFVFTLHNTMMLQPVTSIRIWELVGKCLWLRSYASKGNTKHRVLKIFEIKCAHSSSAGAHKPSYYQAHTATVHA